MRRFGRSRGNLTVNETITMSRQSLEIRISLRVPIPSNWHRTWDLLRPTHWRPRMARLMLVGVKPIVAIVS
jgi:hypothetical protein